MNIWNQIHNKAKKVQNSRTILPYIKAGGVAAAILCIVLVNGCSMKPVQNDESPANSISPTETLTPIPEPTSAVVNELSETQTKTEQSDITAIIELKASHITDIFDDGNIYANLSESDIDFFKNVIEKLEIPDARKGERAKNILEGDDWNKGLVFLNSIPEKNIYLYGYNDEEHYGFGLIMDIGVEQYIYTFPYYYMSPMAIAPSISTSEDDSKIYVTCLTGTGTGVSVSELHIFQVNGGVEQFYVNINRLVELLNNRITMSYDSKSQLMTVYTDGNQITTDYLMDSNVNPTDFSFGNFISYTINNETVKVICDPAIGIKERLIPSYLMNTSLEAEIRFEYDSNGKIIEFDLGEITAVSTTEEDSSSNTN